MSVVVINMTTEVPYEQLWNISDQHIIFIALLNGQTFSTIEVIYKEFGNYYQNFLPWCLV